MPKNSVTQNIDIAKNNATGKIATHVDVMDGLRGLAISMVVLFHIWQMTWLSHAFSIAGFTINLDFIPVTGFLGVEFFLFISAFCLFYPYARYLFEGAKLQTVKHFAYKRAIKIVPSYFLAILLIMVFYSPGFSSVQLSLWHIFTHITFIHNLFPETYGSINGVFWSLGVEVQFYFMFPLLCLFFRKKPLLTCIVMMAIAVGYRYFILIYYFDKLDFLLNQLPGFFDMFACGMLAAYLIVLIRNRLKFYKKLVAFFSIFSVVMFAILIYMLLWLYDIRFETNGIKLWQAENRTYLAIILLLIAVSSSFSINLLKSVIANKILVFMSVISYNLYIWHQLFAQILLKNKIPMAT